MQGTSDARETLVLSSTTEARVEQIEGIGTEQTPSEITGWPAVPESPLHTFGLDIAILQTIAVLLPLGTDYSPFAFLFCSGFAFF